jgi:hypothetical protein
VPVGRQFDRAERLRADQAHIVDDSGKLMPRLDRGQRHSRGSGVTEINRDLFARKVQGTPITKRR